MTSRADELRHIRRQLKSGEYDGTVIMAAWTALEAYADSLDRRAEGVTEEVVRKIVDAATQAPLAYAAREVRKELLAVWPVSAEPAQPADSVGSPRKAFERWITEEMGYAPDDLIWQAKRNCYADYGMHLAWKAWEDSAALAAQGQGEAVGVIEGIDDETNTVSVDWTGPISCGDSLYTAPPASPAGVPEGYYLASFKHGGHGYMLWWGPNDCGYTTDLTQAGVYDQLKSGYHDSEHTVPVPVSMAKHFRIRRMVDVGDTLNAPLHSAKELRAWLASQESQPNG